MFAFGMPQSVMGVSENVNRANAEAGEYTFARWIVKPELTRLKNKLNEQLLPMFPLAKGVEIDFDEVVPETIEQKRLLAESGIKNGSLTINESRKLLGFDPIPNGELLLVPLNLIPTPTSGKVTSNVQNIPPDGKSSTSDITSCDDSLCDDNMLKGGIHSTKGFSPEQKEDLWKRYAQKTERQETMFTRILANQFNEQKKQVIEQLEETGSLAEGLLTSEVAQGKMATALKPAIEEVYSTGYEDAV